MRTRILSILAYTGAGLTLLVAVCVPFVLIMGFSNVVAHAGLHIDATYSGGTIARTIQRERLPDRGLPTGSAPNVRANRTFCADYF